MYNITCVNMCLVGKLSSPVFALLFARQSFLLYACNYFPYTILFLLFQDLNGKYRKLCDRTIKWCAHFGAPKVQCY